MQKKSILQYSSSTFSVCLIAFTYSSTVTFAKAFSINILTSFILNVLFFLATSPLTFTHINSIAFSSECATGNRRITIDLLFFYSILLLPVRFQTHSVHRAPSPSAIIVDWCHLRHKQRSYSLPNPVFFLFSTCIGFLRFLCLLGMAWSVINYNDSFVFYVWQHLFSQPFFKMS